MDIQIVVNGNDYTLTYENAQVFRFRRMPQADHAYYESESTCFYVFNRPDLLAMMERAGARTIIDHLPSENDMTAYVNWTMDTLTPLDDDLEGLE